MDTILDGDKLDAAILALCSSTELSRQALDRGLYLADMVRFIDVGHPLTGTTYVRQQAGPVPQDVASATRLLVAQGRLKRTESFHYGIHHVTFLSIEPFDLGSLSEREVELLGAIGRFVRGGRDAAFSELMVDETVGHFGIGEEIPYPTAYWLVPVEVTDEEVEWAGRQDIGMPLMPALV